MRAVANRPATYRFSVEDDLGDLVDATDPPTVTLTQMPQPAPMSDPVPGVVVSTGPSTRDALGSYSYRFSRPALEVPLTASWAGTVGSDAYSGQETVRMVDRRSIPLSVLRQDAALANIAPADLLALLDGAEDALEKALRFRIVSTMDRFRVTTTHPLRVLRIPGVNYVQNVAAATRTLDPTGQVIPIDPKTIAVRDDALELPTGSNWSFLTGGWPTAMWLPGTYVVDVVHGLTETPVDVVKAVRMLVRHYAANGTSNYPDRATRIVSAETEIWFSRSGPDTYFGIPEVDDVVKQLRLDIPLANNSSF